MPVFNFPPPSTPTIAQRIAQNGSQALIMLAQTRIQNYRAFWSDPVNVAAQFGTNAVALFQADAALVSFLAPQLQAAGAPAAIIAAATAGVPSNWSYVANEDGTVTVSAVTPSN